MKKIKNWNDLVANVQKIATNGDGVPSPHQLASLIDSNNETSTIQGTLSFLRILLAAKAISESKGKVGLKIYKLFQASNRDLQKHLCSKGEVLIFDFDLLPRIASEAIPLDAIFEEVLRLLERSTTRQLRLDSGNLKQPPSPKAGRVAYSGSLRFGNIELYLND